MITRAQKAYIRKETAISMIINAMISAGFVWAMFGARSSAPIWGPGGVAFDFVPQTFMVSLMCALVPTLLTRSRVRSGAIFAIDRPPPRLPRNVAMRSLLLAVVGMTILAGLATAALALSGMGRMDFWPLAAIKVLYGALVALIVTPIALRAALRDEATAKL